MSELLVVERGPWTLELYRLEGDRLVEVGRSTIDKPEVLSSGVVPLTWRLVAGGDRSRIEVTHSDGEQRWVG